MGSFSYHVLHIDKTKVNLWILKILCDRFGEDTGRALLALTRRKDKRGFITVSAACNAGNIALDIFIFESYNFRQFGFG